MIPIVRCDKLATGECPGDWEKLYDAGETDIRTCTECIKAVYRCHNETEARQREAGGHRAAIIPAG